MGVTRIIAPNISAAAEIVAALPRGEEVLLARGKTRLQQGDLLLLLVEKEQAFGKMNDLVNRG